MNHEDEDVATLASVTQNVVRLVRRTLSSEAYERDDANAYLRTSYGRLNSHRSTFANRHDLPWTAIRVTGDNRKEMP